jgi:hypothetical protein
MNRLRDGAGDDPASRREIERLRHTPATPVMRDMKCRIWWSLQQQFRARAPGASSGRLRRPGAKVFVVGATVVALAGTAGAMMAGRWIAPAVDRAVLSSEAGVLALVDAPWAARAHRSSIAPSGRGVVRAAATPRDEVLDALVALRRDREPVRAGALLDRYLAVHQRGALREEALALAMEAADARGDHLLARRYARTYEAEHPEGRFRKFARSHTQPNGPRAKAPIVDSAADFAGVPAAAPRAPRAN